MELSIINLGYIDAFVSAVGMANGILILLRYNEQWYAWFTYLIFDAILSPTSEYGYDSGRTASNRRSQRFGK